MTIKKWCAISKAVDMIATTLTMNVGRAQAWPIEACATGNVRSRAHSVLLMADDGLRHGPAARRVENQQA